MTRALLVLAATVLGFFAGLVVGHDAGVRAGRNLERFDREFGAFGDAGVQ